MSTTLVCSSTFLAARPVATTVPFASNAGDAILAGIAAVANAGFAADAVAINPADFVAIATAKSTGGDYLLGPQAVTPSANLWGVKTVTSPNVPAGTAIVGAFKEGGTLYWREQQAISWAEAGPAEELGAGRDLFTSNAVRCRVESRVLLAIHSPSAFAEVDLAA